jgi:hypothetical protein
MQMKITSNVRGNTVLAALPARRVQVRFFMFSTFLNDGTALGTSQNRRPGSLKFSALNRNCRIPQPGILPFSVQSDTGHDTAKYLQRSSGYIPAGLQNGRKRHIF